MALPARPFTTLFNRLMNAGRPLGEVVGGRMYRGVLTGLNDAFIVDQATRDRLVAADPGCADILKKLLRGQDLRPWYQQDSGQYLIALPCGWTRQQTDADGEESAWEWLAEAYPSVATRLAPFADAAKKRCDKGEFWWELRPCDYYPAFDEPKILWPDIAKLPRFSWDEGGLYVNDKGFIIVGISPWLLAELQTRMEENEFSKLQKRRASTEVRIGIFKNAYLGNPLNSRNFEHKEKKVAWAILVHNLWKLAGMAVDNFKTMTETVDNPTVGKAPPKAA